MKLSMRYLLLCLFSLSCLSFSAWAEVFRIDDIRIEGLQRVSAKTVFSTLPIKANTEASTEQLQDAVRAIFKTGFFSDIDIARDGNVLIVSVVERPAIRRIGVTGNSVIESEPLLAGLKSAGLSEGEIFKQQSLEAVERELNAQYSSIGRYATQIDVKVIEQPQNQVNIGIKITEGSVASIKHINIVGNKDFSEEELQSLFDIKTTGTWSWITGSDKYAQQRLAGDLENLKSYYLNKGYLEFAVTSTQVSLSPDKETVYITVNVFEGAPYAIESVGLAGDLILPEEDVKALITVSEGEVFSQQKLSATSKIIEKRLGDEGYSYASVRGVPELDKDNKTAKVTFFVNPGTINYVRRIVFKGNTTTQDNVLRREMRQLEGAPVSTAKLAQSKARLERLPLFSEVNMRTVAVPGRPDQIDVVFTVVEQASGSINASIGFSQGSGVTFSTGIQQSNWLGTGNTLGFQIQRSDIETSYSFNYTNPYFTPDGISRSFSVFFRERDLDELDIASYSTDRIGASVIFGYPISERSRISLGVGFENIAIQAGSEASQEIAGSPRLRSGVADARVTNAAFQTIESRLSDTNGNDFFDEEDLIASGVNAGASAGAVLDSELTARPDGFLDKYGDDFNTLNFSLGWTDSTLNRGIFPTKGLSQRVNFEVSTPGGDLEYFKFSYRGEFYRALSKSLTLHVKSRFGYADSYGDIDALPFFENFFSGGNGSVRGFEASSLGPKGTPALSYIAVPTSDGNFAYVLNSAGTALETFESTEVQTIGGNILFETGFELIFPVPFTKNSKSLRSLVFVDAGNVFSDSCGSFQVNCSNLDLSKLSSAYGVGLQWLSPIGPVSVYITRALQEQEGDKTESFQFSLGQSF
jgi:outer membrane protein insertion porin family